MRLPVVGLHRWNYILIERGKWNVAVVRWNRVGTAEDIEPLPLLTTSQFPKESSQLFGCLLFFDSFLCYLFGWLWLRNDNPCAVDQQAAYWLLALNPAVRSLLINKLFGGCLGDSWAIFYLVGSWMFIDAWPMTLLRDLLLYWRQVGSFIFRSIIQ